MGGAGMKPGTNLRWMILAFPLGLFLMGLVSVFWSVVKQPDESFDPNEEVRITAAAIRRKAVNESDLARDFAILTETIGPRNSATPEKLEQTAIWIESMLGGSNLGYRIERNEFIHEGQTYRNIVAELPGRAHRDEIILVMAGYDSLANRSNYDSSASAVAAMISLAQAYAGDPQGRTIRFVAVMDGMGLPQAQRVLGTNHYIDTCLRRENRIVAMLRIENLGCQETEPAVSGHKVANGMVVRHEGPLTKYWGDAAVTVLKETGITSRQEFGIEKAPLIRLTNSSAGPLGTFNQAEIPLVIISDTRSESSARAGFDEMVTGVQGLEAVLKVWANP
jgi:Peptidase family M28